MLPCPLACGAILPRHEVPVHLVRCRARMHAATRNEAFEQQFRTIEPPPEPEPVEAAPPPPPPVAKVLDFNPAQVKSRVFLASNVPPTCATPAKKQYPRCPRIKEGPDGGLWRGAYNNPPRWIMEVDPKPPSVRLLKAQQWREKRTKERLLRKKLLLRAKCQREKDEETAAVPNDAPTLMRTVNEVRVTTATI